MQFTLFMKKDPSNIKLTVLLLIAEAKCKVIIGEPGYPIAAVADVTAERLLFVPVKLLVLVIPILLRHY